MSNLVNPYRYVAAGGFLPTDIASLVSWYDADDISTLWTDSARTDQVDANDDVIGSWDDKSGNGNHLLQATTSKKPTYKTNTLNSKPTILGDGVDDSLRDAFTFAQPAHIFIIARQNTWTADDTLLDGYGNNKMRLFQNGTTPDIEQYAGSFGGKDSNMTLATFFLVEAFYSGASSFIKVGDNTATSTNPGTTSPDGLVLFSRGLGTSNYSDANIAEVVACSAELTGSDLTDLRSYFNTQWGVTV